MLEDKCKNDALFNDLKPICEGLGLDLVEAKQMTGSGMTRMYVTVCARGRDTNTDDTDAAYNAIYPRQCMLLNSRDLELEVSTPGLQRNIKDIYEFSVFAGRDVRVYDSSVSSWITGNLHGIGADCISLSDAVIEDGAKEVGNIDLSFKNIQKAKLDYKWKGASHE